MPVLFIAFMLAAAISAYGTYSSAAASRRSADYQADVAEMQVTAARQKASFDEARQRERSQRLKSAAVAKAATSGLTEESFLPVFEESARQAELDAMAIRYGGETSAFGLTAESNLARMRAGTYGKAAGISAASTMLQAGASAYGSGMGGGSGTKV